jgi:hypothetical protein
MLRHRRLRRRARALAQVLATLDAAAAGAGRAPVRRRSVSLGSFRIAA